MARSDEGVALQVIVLGSGGGPFENNTTAFLVRSVAERWSKGSLLAVDAGVHLATIAMILEKTDGFEKEESIENEIENSRIHGRTKTIIANGPFADMQLQHKTAKANAGYIASVLVGTYLISHPHLDHISGLVINSSGLPGTRPKRIAGLPSTISALKTHIFNNTIWPNLSDENNGAGLITFMRLVEGGSPAFGNGEGDGFVEICEGLQVKTWSVSHGHCFEKHKHKHRGTIIGSPSDKSRHRTSSTPNYTTDERIRRTSCSDEQACVHESSAFFIRDIATGTEILMFGDVEPDTISLSPRNRHVWTEAAPRIVEGRLKGIFIECSYDDTRSVDVLFGHLSPKYLIEEIKVLAAEVNRLRIMDIKKRKRTSTDFQKQIRRKASVECFQLSPRSSDLADYDCDEIASFTDPELNDNSQTSLSLHTLSPLMAIASNDEQFSPPLKGIKFVIIHMKEKLDDGPCVADIIFQQLLEHEKQARLGCEFIISNTGQSLYF